MAPLIPPQAAAAVAPCTLGSRSATGTVPAAGAPPPGDGAEQATAGIGALGGYRGEEDAVVDGSVVVTSGARKSHPSALRAVSAPSPSLTMFSAARRKGRRDRSRVEAVAAAGVAGGDDVGTGVVAGDEEALFSDSPLGFLVEDAAAAKLPATKGPTCRLEASEPAGPEERGFVTRAPIFLWKMS